MSKLRNTKSYAKRLKPYLTVKVPSMSFIVSETKGIDQERYVYSLSGFEKKWLNESETETPTSFDYK